MCPKSFSGAKYERKRFFYRWSRGPLAPSISQAPCVRPSIQCAVSHPIRQKPIQFKVSHSMVTHPIYERKRFFYRWSRGPLAPSISQAPCVRPSIQCAVSHPIRQKPIQFNSEPFNLVLLILTQSTRQSYIP